MTWGVDVIQTRVTQRERKQTSKTSKLNKFDMKFILQNSWHAPDLLRAIFSAAFLKRSQQRPNQTPKIKKSGQMLTHNTKIYKTK